MEPERCCQNGLWMIQLENNELSHQKLPGWITVSPRNLSRDPLAISSLTGKSSFEYRCHNFMKCKIISTEILLHSMFLNVEHMLQWLIFGSSWLYPEFKIFSWSNVHFFIIPLHFIILKLPYKWLSEKCFNEVYKNVDENSTKPHHTD